MFEKLPSLLGLNPKFYTGAPARFHLPFLYDLVAGQKPKSIVTLGFGDGQAFFTLCQAAREQNVECQCAAVRRPLAGEAEDADSAWLAGKDYGDEFYGDLARFHGGPDAVKEFQDQSIDLLLLDDCASGAEIRGALALWETKLAPDGFLLVHGIALERADSPKAAWLGWAASRTAAEFPDGIGLGVTWQSELQPPRAQVFQRLFAGKDVVAELAETYRLAVARIEAQVRADEAVRAQAALETRQVWTNSLLADRWNAQEIMDHQARALADGEQRFQALLTDRANAQLVMDGQRAEIQNRIAETEKLQAGLDRLKAQTREQKRILNAAKKACRKDGRCFRISDGPKVRRPFTEKVLREIRRLPRNLGISRPPRAAPHPKKPPAVGPSEPVPSARLSADALNQAVDRYATWISEHEPDAAALEKQRRAARRLQTRPKISLLVPVYNTPANFLAEMFASVSAQTYDNWELCAVDGGSDRPETLATLQAWIAREPRIRLERLETNLGIAENTNRALRVATGDFVACVDHDDLLAPFALFELARAIGDVPEADIFYSDEDRWSAAGKRHAPFFKPEWSPELLCSFMYICHLTAYRRSFVDQIGEFRKEFDLSQDYDFALRATERARAIHHIPHVLYHWREHPASGSVGGKPGARRTNLLALAEAMRRRNLPAHIIEYLTANRARLKIDSWPSVSIIVPTDSLARARSCLRDLPSATKYPNLEIVVVTNSALGESLKILETPNVRVRLVPYDKPFNFSDKCNLGAEAATGDRLIFFNDDVETAQADWIQNLIEPLENPEVGAVSPKLLYQTGKIQHCGLVMGVRGLAGTAFHQRHADSTEHFNMAQSLRPVAALSAACLAMRRVDFFRLGGFDAANTPIAHSDIDLCFRIREAGLRCVYTPYATLSHAGHASIALEEKKNAVRPRDKASIYLLKRWGRSTTHDPYFTDNMRSWLHSDSPTPIRMVARDQPGPITSSCDLLFVSHDLSLSGAPMMLFQAARWCRQHGYFVVVVAPKGGPLAGEFEAEGIPVIIDPLVDSGHESFVRFARDFDCIVANTILSAAAVYAMKDENVPVAWWIHEPGSVGAHYIRGDERVRAALMLADMLLVPSEATAAFYGPFSGRPTRCVRNAIRDPGFAHDDEYDGAEPAPVRFLLLASIEPRKGQDIFVEALALLPRELQEAARFEIAGRILDPDFWAKVKAAARPLKNFSARGPLNHREAIQLMRDSHVVVSASRDEAMPTIAVLEAMSLGKALVVTAVGGAGEVLADGEDALLVRPETPAALAAALRRLIEDRGLVAELGEKSRATYESNFTMERFGAEFRGAIDEVMASAATARRRNV